MRWSLRSLLPAFVCCCASLLITPSVCFAQSSLPRDLVENANPTDAEQSQIADAARRAAQALANGSGRDVERARKDLLRPFTAFNNQSIAFRFAYGRTAASELRSVTQSDDVHRAVNALLALGPMGVLESQEVISDALGDSRAAVRLAAATAMADTIQGDTRVSSLRDTAQVALNNTAAALKKETDPAVASAMVSAMSVSNTNVTMLPLASERLAEVLPGVIGNLPEGFDALAWSKAMARASVTCRAGVLNATARDAARIRLVTRAMASELAFVDRVLTEHEDLAALSGSPLGAELMDIVSTASSQIELARQQLNVSNTIPNLLSAMELAIEEQDASGFTDAFRRLAPALNAMGVGENALDPGTR